MTNKKRVLIVEDSKQWQGILSETLEDEGYDVTVMANYPYSRRALQNARFDLVVVDLELNAGAPTLEGKRLLNLISRHYADTPSIVVSGKGDMQTMRDAFKRYNVVDFITKEHFDIAVFNDAVQSALKRQKSAGKSRKPSQEGTNPDASFPGRRGVLSITEYDHILQIVHNMGEVMERSPNAFKEMGEEDLRQHFLVQLNGQFAGRATGETFNYTGKTDILIRVNGKNIFIAECKFWTGPKGFASTIDQLLGYINWRDTKTAILLFNRNRNFSYVLSKIPDLVKSHPCFKRQIGVAEETVFRYVFKRPDDPQREFRLAILAFDIPR
jgi:DNA-binding response OmpR family regulator